MFAIVGLSISKYPKTFMVCGFLISLISFGCLKINLQDHIQDGYTPQNAPSYFETKIMREFWNSSGDSMITTIIIKAKNGSNMLSADYLDNAVEVNNFLTNKFEIYYNNQSIKFSNLCDPYCDINKPLEIFLLTLKNEMESKSDFFNLSYPVTEIFGEHLHMERFFFGVQLKTNESLFYKNLSAEQNVTNIYSIKVIALMFRSDRSTLKKNIQLSQWELNVYDYLNKNFSNDLIDVQIIGSEILNKAMLDNGKQIVPYFAIGFLLTLIFVFSTVTLKAIHSKSFDLSKIWCSIITILSPFIAITVTFGMLALLRVHVNSFLLILPFLVFGIGVDDGFLLMHSWFYHNNVECNNKINRLSAVLNQVGPSITLTTLTNVISFGIGIFSPTSEISLFCFGTTLSLTFVYILQFLFLCPTFVLTKRYEQKILQITSFDNFTHNKLIVSINNCNGQKIHTNDQFATENLYKNQKNKILNSFNFNKIDIFDIILNLYCKIISNKIFAFFLLILMSGYWYLSIFGTINIKTQLDATKILPKNSQIQKSNLILDEIIWNEYYPVSIFVNKHFDLSNKTQVAQFYKMINEFESILQCRGSESSLIWLKEYEEYLKTKQNDDDTLHNLNVNKTKKINSELFDQNLLLRYNTCELKTFFDLSSKNHWKGFVKLSNIEQFNNQTDCPKIERFWVTIAYKNASTWSTRINLTLQWRAIAERYTNDLNTTIWQQNSMFVDQMLNLTTITLQSGLLTFGCMIVICIFFISNPFNVFAASFVIASICLGVFGFLSWLKFDLDPIVMAGLLMSIGLSVDYTAHVSYHFQQNVRKEHFANVLHQIPITNNFEKLRYTFSCVGWPMLQASLSTVLCVLPFALIDQYAAKVFLNVICLITVLGIFHGVVVLPCFLSMLPEFCTSGNFYRRYFSSKTSKSYSIAK